MLIPNQIRFFLIYASQGFKSGYNYFLAVCEYMTSVLTHQSPEKKFIILKLFHLKYDWIIFKMIWSGPPSYHKSASVFKTAV
jgi:hypothetical protein